MGKLSAHSLVRILGMLGVDITLEQVGETLGAMDAAELDELHQEVESAAGTLFRLARDAEGAAA